MDADYYYNHFSSALLCLNYLHYQQLLNSIVQSLFSPAASKLPHKNHNLNEFQPGSTGGIKQKEEILYMTEGPSCLNKDSKYPTVNVVGSLSPI